MFLIFARLFGVPVSARAVFGADLPEGEFGQVLEGDPSVPPTTIPTWPAWANAIRNAILAAFVWREYSVLKLDGLCPSEGVYLVYGTKAMPYQIQSRYIAVRHGREACRFAICDATGVEVPFTVVGRGGETAILKALDDAVRSDLLKRGFDDREVSMAMKYGPESFCAFL